MNIEVSLTHFLQLQCIHPTKEEFVAAAKTWAKTLNYFVSVDKSEEDRVILICVRGGRQRDKCEATRTIKCNCPFKVTGRKQKIDGGMLC